MSAMTASAHAVATATARPPSVPTAKSSSSRISAGGGGGGFAVSFPPAPLGADEPPEQI